MKEILPEIFPNNPFENCLFDRKKYADILINLINNHQDGFVMSINNGWGTGKTTFIEMLKQALINENFETVYFNAWENDYDTDPLVSILGELKMLANPIKDKAKIDKLVSNGSKLVVNTLGAILKHQAEKHLGEAAVDVFKTITENGQEIVEKEINDYSEKKKNINDFRANLKDYIASRENENPIIFIIDELDRCRPDYGINFLESIKHFFNVPNIVFILSIDKEQLGAAIKGFYGSESINADEYLKKIIDLELSLPYPDLDLYYKKNINTLQIKDLHLKNPQFDIQSLRSELKKQFDLLYNNEKMPVRVLNKILNHQKLVIQSFSYDDYLSLSLISFLIYLKYVHNDIYQKLIKRDISMLETLKNILVQKFDGSNFNSYERYFMTTIYTFIIIYFDSQTNLDDFKRLNINQQALIQLEEFINNRKSELQYDLGYNISKNFNYFDKIEFLSNN